MNKKVLAGVIALVVIVGAVFLLTRNKNSDDKQVASNMEGTAKMEESSSQEASIKTLMASGKPQTCTFSSGEKDVESTGTVYVTSGKMRGDFTMTVNGTKTVSHMVTDGSMAYMWADGQTTGMKMKMDANSNTSANSQNNYVDPNKNYNYKCENWSADNDKFIVPTAITFTDLSAMMQAGASASSSASGSVDVKAMQRAACNNLPEPSKTQCLSTLK